MQSGSARPATLDASHKSLNNLNDWLMKSFYRTECGKHATEARGSRTHLDDGHQTDPGLLCDTLPSLSQSAPIFCRKHTDETEFLL